MKKILEIGCGQGFNSYLLSKKKGNEIIGVDLFSPDIEIAKRRYPKVDFRVMNVEKLDFKDKVFDEIYAMDILEHVDNLEKVLTECIRVLKVGGKFIINVPAEKSEAWLLSLRPSYFNEIHHVRIIKNEKNELESLLDILNCTILDKKPRGFLQHVDLYWLFTRTKKSDTQLGIGNWRDTKMSMFIHIAVLFFDGSVLQTPLIWFPFWVITIPIGLPISFIGDRIFPKSFYYKFQKLS